MCTHLRRIFNPYSRRSILVPCGKCDACLQEKACKRSNRIRNNITPDKIALFCTLTYTNDYVPYILRSDLYGDNGDINVYRNASCRFTYSRHDHRYSFKKDSGCRPIDKVFVPFENRCCSVYDNTITRYQGLIGLGKEYIGVPYYKDLQLFYKRLRQILNRHYDYKKQFSYFSCSELGGHTYRPHFHSLIFIDPEDEKIFRNAILEAWPYADKCRTQKYIELARDAASYVSSYVNCHLDVLPLFEVPVFKPSHSASKDFGVVLDCFSLSSIVRKIDSGDLHYYRRQKFDGETDVLSVPVPEYVINRYFPKFKGSSWLTSSQLSCVLSSPERIAEVFCDGSRGFLHKESGKIIPFQVSSKIDNPLYDFSPKETYRIYVRLKNCLDRFIRETGLNNLDYALYYQKAWSLHQQSSIKDSLMNIQEYNDWSDYYENANDVVAGLCSAPTLFDLSLQCDPNARKDIVDKSNNFKVLFHKLDKQKKVTNYCMSRMGHHV